MYHQTFFKKDEQKKRGWPSVSTVSYVIIEKGASEYVLLLPAPYFVHCFGNQTQINQI